ncbi:MAG: YgeY family selenium metabolism-linked hydrolase [Chloroflexota bacterium]
MYHLSTQEQSQLNEFLSLLVQTRSLSGKEKEIADLLVSQLEAFGLERVRIDPMGNVIAILGRDSGPTLLMNGHMDTVDVTDASGWSYDPWAGTVVGDSLYGLGACDMKSSIAAMVFAAKKLNENQTILPGKLILAFVVQEEPCEGAAMRHIVEEQGIKPDWVLLGEPSHMKICRGQRGRVEMRVTTRGRSSHAARPHDGTNAIFGAMRLVFGIELLSGNLAHDRFLGPGTIAITQIESEAPSRNAVPDRCSFYIDRRLTLGETEERALAEIQAVIMREGIPATVDITDYVGTSYTGYGFHQRDVFPAWALPESHPLVTKAIQSLQKVMKHKPELDRWDFSTDGVYTMGHAHIPTIGFGPGRPELAHSPDEHVHLPDVHQAVACYAQLAVSLLE